MNYSFFRAELQKVLLEHLLLKNQVRLNQRLVSYVQLLQSNGLELLFEDGTTAACDVLLGCDGIRSRVRATMYSKLLDDAQAQGKPDEAEKLRSHISPVFSGEVVYRCLIRKDALPQGVAEHRAFDTSDLIIVSPWNNSDSLGPKRADGVQYCGKNRVPAPCTIYYLRVIDEASSAYSNISSLTRQNPQCGRRSQLPRTRRDDLRRAMDVGGNSRGDCRGLRRLGARCAGTRSGEPFISPN